MNHSWRFMDIRVQRIGDANNNMNRIINANIRCGRISNPTERDETINFSDFTMSSLLENDDLGNFMKYEDVARSYKGEAQGRLASNVMTDIMRHFDGIDVFGTQFDFSTLAYGMVLYGDNEHANFTTTHEEGKIKITAHNGTPKDYEATVENLASTLIVHEWYGHGVLKYGNNRRMFGIPLPNHYKVYEKVMLYDSFFKKTTPKYKESVYEKYKLYRNKEKLWP